MKAVLSDIYASKLAEESQEVRTLKRIIDRMPRDKVRWLARRAVVPLTPLARVCVGVFVLLAGDVSGRVRHVL